MTLPPTLRGMASRLLGVLAATALVVAASGCASDPGPRGESPAPRGCGDCTQQLDDLKATLEGLDDVTSVEMATFDSDTDDRGQLYVQLTVAAPDLASADTAAIADEPSWLITTMALLWAPKRIAT